MFEEHPPDQTVRVTVEKDLKLRTHLEPIRQDINVFVRGHDLSLLSGFYRKYGDMESVRKILLNDPYLDEDDLRKIRKWDIVNIVF